MGLPWLWGWPANLFNLYRARRYLTTYSNLQRPWRLLEERGARLREVHVALWGSAYVAMGTLPPAATHWDITRPHPLPPTPFTPRPRINKDLT